VRCCWGMGGGGPAPCAAARGGGHTPYTATRRDVVGEGDDGRGVTGVVVREGTREATWGGENRTGLEK
jgi:hypothetical protein